MGQVMVALFAAQVAAQSLRGNATKTNMNSSSLPEDLEKTPEQRTVPANHILLQDVADFDLDSGDLGESGDLDDSNSTILGTALGNCHYRRASGNDWYGSYCSSQCDSWGYSQYCNWHAGCLCSSGCSDHNDLYLNSHRCYSRRRR